MFGVRSIWIKAIYYKALSSRIFNMHADTLAETAVVSLFGDQKVWERW